MVDQTKSVPLPAPLPLPVEDVNWSSVSLAEVIQRKTRIEARLYGIEGKHAREVLSDSRWSVVNLLSKDGFIQSASYPTRFKRIYVRKQNGIALYMPSQLNELRPKPLKFISEKSKTSIDGLKVKHGQLLLTRSGTIGNCTLVSKTLEGRVFSDDVIRVEFKNPDDAGYVYTFMKTKIGQTLIRTNNYGAVISHIEPEHLGDVPIPDPSRIIKSLVHGLIADSFRLRDQSNELIEQAEQLLVDELKLPLVEELKIRRFEETDELQNYCVKLSSTATRFESTYHKPIIHSIVEHLQKYAAEVSPITDNRISSRIILPGRFKRVYVEAGQGVVFFGGKTLLQLDPSGDKFLSLRHHDKRIKDELTIKEKMVLITCSGTIGKVALAPKHWDDWTANQHILRVVPANDDIAGYLYIWLSSVYGYELIRRFTYGAVVDEIDDDHLAHVQVPLLKQSNVQKQINALALEANEKRYEAYLLEQQAIDVVNKQVIYAVAAGQSSKHTASGTMRIKAERAHGQARNASGL